jgi:hypothetical protein
MHPIHGRQKQPPFLEIKLSSSYDKVNLMPQPVLPTPNHKPQARLALMLGLMLMTAAPAYAETANPVQIGRCECEQNLGPCKGSAEYGSQWLTLSSSSLRCSEVRVQMGEEVIPYKVTDGRSRYPWLKDFPENASVIDCRICGDNQYPAEGDQPTEAQPAPENTPVRQEADYASDMRWLEGVWCWDWYGRPGTSSYRHIKDNHFMWGTDQEQEITIEGNIMKARDKIGAYFEREIIDHHTLLWTKRAMRGQEHAENVKMWRCK